jgi:hypothetical protein
LGTIFLDVEYTNIGVFAGFIWFGKFPASAWELSTADVARCPPALDALSTPLDVMRSLQYSPFENAPASNHEVDNKLSQAIAAGIQFAPNSLRIPPSNGIQLPFLSV